MRWLVRCVALAAAACHDDEHLCDLAGATPGKPLPHECPVPSCESLCKPGLVCETATGHCVRAPDGGVSDAPPS